MLLICGGRKVEIVLFNKDKKKFEDVLLIKEETDYFYACDYTITYDMENETNIDFNKDTFSFEFIINFAGDKGIIRNTSINLSNKLTLSQLINQENPILDIETSELKALIGHRNIIYYLKVNPVYQDMLLSTSQDCSIRLWNFVLGVQLAIFGGKDGHGKLVISVDWHFLGRRFCSGGADKIRIWDLDEEIIEYNEKLGNEAINEMENKDCDEIERMNINIINNDFNNVEFNTNNNNEIFKEFEEIISDYHNKYYNDMRNTSDKKDKNNALIEKLSSNIVKNSDEITISSSQILSPVHNSMYSNNTRENNSNDNKNQENNDHDNIDHTDIVNSDKDDMKSLNINSVSPDYTVQSNINSHSNINNYNNNTENIKTSKHKVKICPFPIFTLDIHCGYTDDIKFIGDVIISKSNTENFEGEIQEWVPYKFNNYTHSSLNEFCKEIDNNFIKDNKDNKDKKLNKELNNHYLTNSQGVCYLLLNRYKFKKKDDLFCIKMSYNEDYNTITVGTKDGNVYVFKRNEKFCQENYHQENNSWMSNLNSINPDLSIYMITGNIRKAILTSYSVLYAINDFGSLIATTLKSNI